MSATARVGRGEGLGEPGDDLVHRRGRRFVVERDPSYAGAVSLRKQAQRLMGGVEVVLGGEDLLARRHLEPAVHQAESQSSSSVSLAR